MLAITAANGQLGQRVIQNLLQKIDATQIVALVRSPEKAEHLKTLGIEVRRADYNQAETLAPPLAGVDKLLLISGNEIGQRVAQHRAVIDAAKEAGVSLLAYTSLLKAGSTPMAMAEEHVATEALIKASGLPAVILRNGWYSENYTESIDAVLQAGMVAGAAGEGLLYTASREDYAAAAAAVLTSTEPQAGKVYELAGDRGFTLAQYAAEIANQSGQPVQYQNMSGTEFAALLEQIGLPQGFAALLADTEVHAADGWLAETSGTLSRLIGRPTTPIEVSIQTALR